MHIFNSGHIKNSLSILDALNAVEEAFLAQETGGFKMPDRMHVELSGNVLLVMPAFGGEFISTKLVSVFPGNNKKNIPSIFGSVILSDGESGKPLALLEGSTLTALRTGAVGGLAVAYTTPKNITKLGLVGAGTQGFHQVLFAATVRNIDQITVYDPFKKDLEEITNSLQKMLPHVNIFVTENISECIRNSEVIITATTSETPVIPDNKKLLEGKHFIGIGSYKPSMREYPDSLFSLINEVIVDTPYAGTESGDLKIPLDRHLIDPEKIITLGKLINHDYRADTGKTTFFKSVGMALFDLFTAKAVYKNALDKGIGIEVDF